tara:strand:+ start:411 stop:809 length:399 start_codon:yes stop_codon:yes gene_type:complete
MKKIKGYITSKSFLSERVPQNVQNLFLRNFCKINGYEYLLSGTEYSMENSYHILDELIYNLNQYDGIAAYSVFQLPEKSSYRSKLLNKILNKKKIFLCAIENIKIERASDIKYIETLWRIKQSLPKCFRYVS